MRIGKSKTLEASQISVHKIHPPNSNKDNGIMAVPIPAEQRANADKEMKDYMNQFHNA